MTKKGFFESCLKREREKTMGNEQTNENVAISPKIQNAINNFKLCLNNIESEKEQRLLILECKVDKEFNDKFNLNQWIHIARFVLENDKNIANMRQKCVPSLIKENEFWKRYFYLVKQQKKNKKKNKKKKEKKNKKEEERKEEEEKEEESEDIIYQVLLHKPLVWLYKIPATIWRGRNNKCELWGLRNPLWSGRLRIIAFNHGKHLQFQFLEKDGKLFLKSTLIKLNEINGDDIHEYFDAYGVIDSSRYFIIWIDLPNKTKTIPFGFGIRERQDAFDIRAVVADQMKIIKRGHTHTHNNDNNNYNIIGDNDDDDNDNDNDNDQSEYEWITDDEYKDNDHNSTKDNLERKCIEIEINDKKTKKWMKKIKINKKKRKNRFELDEDEMISIGHDIDCIEHHHNDNNNNHSNYKHSTILKIDAKNINYNKNGNKNDDNDDLYLLPPPPSPPLTPQDELTHINDKRDDNDDDFGEFQAPNDMENDNENEGNNDGKDKENVIVNGNDNKNINESANDENKSK